MWQNYCAVKVTKCLQIIDEFYLKVRGGKQILKPFQKGNKIKLRVYIIKGYCQRVTFVSTRKTVVNEHVLTCLCDDAVCAKVVVPCFKCHFRKDQHVPFSSQCFKLFDDIKREVEAMTRYMEE